MRSRLIRLVFHSLNLEVYQGRENRVFLMETKHGLHPPAEKMLMDRIFRAQSTPNVFCRLAEKLR